MTVNGQSRPLMKMSGESVRYNVAPTLSRRQCLRFLLRSATGSPYEIFVSLPREAPPPEGFPVLYLLDANADFALADHVVERLTRRPEATGVEPAIIVGIGYPDTESYNQERRHFDFTAGPTEDAFYETTTYEFGGQDAFITFIRDSLKPVIRSHFPVNEDNETVLGHSLGGYFVVELAIRAPSLFSGYIAVSPSLWWDPECLFENLRTRQVQPQKPIRLFLAVGGWECDPAPWQQYGTRERAEEKDKVRRSRQMIGNIDLLSKQCRAICPDSILVSSKLIDDEDHSSVYVVCLPGALRFALPARVT